VVAFHLSPVLSTYIVNTKIEGAICVVMAGFWAITVAIVSNAKSGLAVDEGSANTVMNGNVSGLFYDFAMIAILCLY
jgi:hypothetical protein